MRSTASLMAAAGLLAALTACSPGTTASGGTASCGQAKTAAGVPVLVEIPRAGTGGTAPTGLSCAEAIRVERRYTAEISSGKVPGNGGGAPVTVHENGRAWTCQGYATPEILKTGATDRCVSGASQIREVLASPGASPGSGA